MVLTVNNLRPIIHKRRPMWIKDNYVARAIDLIKSSSSETRVIRADHAFPLDIEEMFQAIELDSDSKGVILIEGLERAHPYMVGILESAVRTRIFQRGCMSRAVQVPDTWKFVIVTNPTHRIRSHSLYRDLFKLTNDSIMEVAA